MPDSNFILLAVTRALKSLKGLSVGDAFGEQFFLPDAEFNQRLERRELPAGQWSYTDDTEMRLSIVAILREHSEIQEAELLKRFAKHFDYTRGYGPSMQRSLRQLQEGAAARDVFQSAFGGQGSFGNGSAMRAGPIGAYFVDDLPQVVEQARRSSMTTHTHPEAVAGAIAVAVAAALASTRSSLQCSEFLHRAIEWVPDSEVRSKLIRAAGLPVTYAAVTAASILGNGTQLSAQDTVPFALWCAAQHLNSYQEALWNGVSASGDRDTICAIVGSIVVMSAPSGVPQEWLNRREAYPAWFTAK